MYCLNCGKELTDGDVFCSSCGTKINEEKVICPDCGKKVDIDEEICPRCGSRIDGQQVKLGCAGAFAYVITVMGALFFVGLFVFMMVGLLSV